MPEAAMNKDRLASPSEYEVRCSWKSTIVKAVSEAHRVDESTYNHLGFAIAATHPRHSRATLIGREGVHVHCLKVRGGILYQEASRRRIRRTAIVDLIL